MQRLKAVSQSAATATYTYILAFVNKCITKETFPNLTKYQQCHKNRFYEVNEQIHILFLLN